MSWQHQQKKDVSDKIIERVRRLMAMGSDVSSQNEANIALRRARALMDEYQITLTDLEKLIDDDFGVSEYNSGSSRQKIWVSTLAASVAELNDCLVDFKRITKRQQSKVYEFKGFVEDVKVCEFMLVYLVDACNRMYSLEKDVYGLSGMSDKNDYLNGMVNALCVRMKLITLERQKIASKGCTERSLVVLKTAAVEEKFGVVTHTKNKNAREANAIAWVGGSDAAKDIHLGSFVGTSQTEVVLLEN